MHGQERRHGGTETRAASLLAVMNIAAGRRHSERVGSARAGYVACRGTALLHLCDEVGKLIRITVGAYHRRGIRKGIDPSRRRIRFGSGSWRYRSAIEREGARDDMCGRTCAV